MIIVIWTAAAPGNRNKEIVLKNCAPFTDCLSEINSTNIDSAKDIDVLISMYNLIEFSKNYSQRSESLWLYYREKPTLDNNDNIIDFLVNDDTSLSLACKKCNWQNRKRWHKKILKYGYH